MSVGAREANVFACLADTVVAPGARLPALANTDVIAFLSDYLDRSPRLNRVGMRALLLAIEVAPLLLGYRARLRGLPPARRVAVLEALEHSPAAPLVRALEGLAKLAYYGDDGVMRELGYDASAVVARGRAIRHAEGRW